jgi:hypothetical protein
MHKKKLLSARMVYSQTQTWKHYRFVKSISIQFQEMSFSMAFYKYAHNPMYLHAKVLDSKLIETGLLLEYDDTDNDVSKELGQDYKEDDTWTEVLPKHRREPLKTLKMQKSVKCH